MRSKTVQKGEIACLKVELEAVRHGLIISKPLTDCCDYDRIIDYGQKLERIQIKYGDGQSTHSVGCITVSLERTSKGKLLYDATNVDAIFVYLPKIDKVCRFEPKDFVGKSKLYVRIEPPKRNHTKNVMLVENFVWKPLDTRSVTEVPDLASLSVKRTAAIGGG